MGEKRQGQEGRDPFQMERQNNARAAMRVLLALYLAYVIYQLIKGYASGESGMSPPLFAGAILLFSVAEVAILAFSVKRWKRGKERVDQVWEERESAAPQSQAASAEEPEDPL